MLQLCLFLFSELDDINLLLHLCQTMIIPFILYNVKLNYMLNWGQELDETLKKSSQHLYSISSILSKGFHLLYLQYYLHNIDLLCSLKYILLHEFYLIQYQIIFYIRQQYLKFYSPQKTIMKPRQQDKNDHTQNQKKTFYEIYTTYIEPSNIVLNHYQNKPKYEGQEIYLEKLDDWLENDEEPNRPFVLKTSPGIGTKTILSSWYNKLMHKNETSKQKNLVVTHFASLQSNCSNYFYCLYRIITKLRESLKILEKVDLLEQKIRKYFAYWLDICNSEIEKQKVIFCKETIYDKIVIIIEGVHLFRDAENNGEANIAFWLPEMFPKNVKIVCTVEEDSESLQYFQKKNCEIINLEMCPNIAERLLEKTLETQTFLECDVEKSLKTKIKEVCNKLIHRQNSEIYKIIQNLRSFFLPQESSFNKEIKNHVRKVLAENVKQGKILTKISEIQTLTDLYNLIIDLWEENLPCRKKLNQYLLYLCLTQKGLILKEILELTRCSQKQWEAISSIFRNFFIAFEQNYSIKCKSLGDFLVKRYKSNQNNQTSLTHPPKQSSNLMKYHQKIAQCLENTGNSIRKLEEQTYHLFTAKSYFKLKEIVSNVENFLLLFNSNNKYQLSRYWQKLEEKGFDPVIEYNKSIENFSMHYHPSDQNIFRIIVQISRFLKEFCDFETYDTPKFRHPIIEGNMFELHKIGLLKEFTELDIYVDNSFADNEGNDKNKIRDADLGTQIKLIRQKYFPKNVGDMQLQNLEDNSPKKSKMKNSNDNLLDVYGENEKNKIVPNKCIRSKNGYHSQITSEVEQINVDVPKSRDKFREHYLKILQQFMQSDEFEYSNTDQGYFVVNYDDRGSGAISSHHIAGSNDQIPERYLGNQLSAAKIKQSYRMRSVKPSLYYYKRWIWIQFPWVCISLNNNYSNTPQFMSNNLEGLDIDPYEQQAKYTKQALMIAIEAKQKKKLMFTKKSGNGFNTTGLQRTGFSNMKSAKNSQSNGLGSLGMSSGFSKYGTNKFGMNNEKSSARSKIMQKTFTNIDLSLNALTKELELRKKKLPPGYVLENESSSKNSPSFFLSQINYNQQQDQNHCRQDLKFINQRKKFDPPNISNMASNEILPKLKWTIKDHTNYEINYIKAHIEEKKKKLNKIIYSNKKLAEVYKELKLKENLAKKSLDIEQKQNDEPENQTVAITKERQEETDEVRIDEHPDATQIQSNEPSFSVHKMEKNSQLAQLLKKKQSVIEQFCKSVLQKERLKIILKLCAQNKTKNEESLSSLNYFLQNLKKMIQFQKSNLKELTKEISGIKQLKEKKNLMQHEKIKNHRVLERQAKNYLEEKNKLETQIENISVVIGEELRLEKDRLDSMFTGHIKSKEQRDVIVMQQRKNKMMDERLEEVKGEWQALQNLFGVKEGETEIENTEKFKKMLEQNERNKKLKIIYFEKKNRLEEVKAEYEKVKQEHAKEISALHTQVKTVDTHPQQSNSRQKNNPSKQELQLTILLNNMALKLGVQNVSDIVPCLKQKLANLKEKDIDKYTKIMNMGTKSGEQELVV